MTIDQYPYELVPMLVRVPGAAGLERRDVPIYQDPGWLCPVSEYGAQYRKVGTIDLKGWGDMDGPACVLTLDGSLVEYYVPARLWRWGQGC